jgi:hypothetical protein
MKVLIFCAGLVAFAVLAPVTVSAQSRYDAHRAFSPQGLTAGGDALRSASGAPGPADWQNRADYRVRVRFDTATKLISGAVTIRYTNFSPEPLPFLWLYLDQNIDNGNSRASRMRGEGVAGAGVRIKKVAAAIEGAGTPASVPYVVDGTRMQLRLPHAVAPGGGEITLVIDYAYTLLPSGGGGRSGYLDTRGGRIFEVSYWYPRMCVFDDIRGWNTLPFLGSGEFYMDYGSIDYTVELPSGMLVAGSGALQNAPEVLTPLESSRLRAAGASDQTLVIRRTGEPATRRSPDGWLSWHFHMDSTRDVAWAASAAFRWDAARVRLPEARSCMAMSFYPAESASDSLWGRATEYLKSSVEQFSRDWYPYPYPRAINVAGRVGGMEFPGITFDWWRSGRKGLFALLSHEIGHNWFPMIVGSNERRDAWMDEGFNTFIDLYAQQHFNHGEYAPKRDGEYAPGGGNPAREIVPFITRKGISPIMSLADQLPARDVHPLEYFKTAYGLVLLREVILGPGRFDYAFRRYIRDWAFRHPSPADFFREMENGAGEDLGWFWKGWFLHQWQLDQAVKSVRYPDGPSGGALVTLENLGEMPMTTLVRVTDARDSVSDIRLPVEIWERGDTWSFRVPATVPLKSVTLDPDTLLPDVDRSNNRWTAP